MNYEIGIASFVAAEAVTLGQLCVLTEDKTLTPLTSALAASNTNTALFVANLSGAAGDLVSAKIVGACSGTVVVKCAAGEITPGAPVFVGDAGNVALEGSRQVGVYIGAAKTLEDGAPIEIAPVFVAASAA